MSISKELHDELCTSYAALALYDGDVSDPPTLNPLAVDHRLGAPAGQLVLRGY